jgi:hypothetical protein
MKPTAGFNVHPENINRDGPPKKLWTWSGLIREKMEMTKDGKEIKGLVIDSLIGKAIGGDINAIKEVGNRIDGMPIQNNDITSKGESLNGLIVIKTNRAE